MTPPGSMDWPGTSPEFREAGDNRCQLVVECTVAMAADSPCAAAAPPSQFGSPKMQLRGRRARPGRHAEPPPPPSAPHLPAPTPARTTMARSAQLRPGHPAPGCSPPARCPPGRRRQPPPAWGCGWSHLSGDDHGRRSPPTSPQAAVPPGLQRPGKRRPPQAVPAPLRPPPAPQRPAARRRAPPPRQHAAPPRRPALTSGGCAGAGWSSPSVRAGRWSCA